MTHLPHVNTHVSFLFLVVCTTIRKLKGSGPWLAWESPRTWKGTISGWHSSYDLEEVVRAGRRPGRRARRGGPCTSFDRQVRSAAWTGRGGGRSWPLSRGGTGRPRGRWGRSGPRGARGRGGGPRWRSRWRGSSRGRSSTTELVNEKKLHEDRAWCHVSTKRWCVL